MNENLIKLNPSVANTMFPKRDFLAEDAGLWNSMSVPSGSRDKTETGLGYTTDPVISV